MGQFERADASTGQTHVAEDSDSPRLAPFMSGPPRDEHSTGGETRRMAERRIRNRALTIGVSVTPFGLSFGAVSVEAHLSLVQVCLLSLVLFSGASQFALVSIIGAGGSYFSAVGTALLLGVRNGCTARASTRCCVLPDGVAF